MDVFSGLVVMFKWKGVDDGAKCIGIEGISNVGVGTTGYEKVERGFQVLERCREDVEDIILQFG